MMKLPYLYDTVCNVKQMLCAKQALQSVAICVGLIERFEHQCLVETRI